MSRTKFESLSTIDRAAAMLFYILQK